MKFIVRVLVFPFSLLIGLLFALHKRKQPEPEMFTSPGHPNQKWLEWYRCKHFTSLLKAKAAFMALSKTFEEPSYFEQPEEWFKWVQDHPLFEGIEDDRKALLIRTAARSLDIRGLCARTTMEEPKDLLSDNREAFNIDWINYHSAIKGISMECVQFHEIQKQVREHNRFVEDVYLNA